MVFPAAAVLFVAAIGTENVPASIAALVVGVGCVAGGPVLACGIVIVAANDPHLFRDPAFGSVTAVDVAIGATLARTAFVASRRRPSRLELCALGFLLASAGSTAFAHGSTPTTAYGRVASYLVLGLVVGRALSAADRSRLTRIFVGAAVGQATAALIGLTPTAATDFPFGRYLGTLGDPAQFGIPIAFAGILVAVSPHIVRCSRTRYAVTAVLCIAVAGSVTRSAWAALGTGFLCALLARAGRERSTATRVALGTSAIAAASLATVLVIVGAGALGLTQASATIRRRSIDAAWTYFAAHPLRPIGLGSRVGGASEPVITTNPIFVSTFEDDTSGWVSFRGAKLVRLRKQAGVSNGALKVVTQGTRRHEGMQLSMIGGMKPHSPYTLSVLAKIPPGVRVWFYADEYNAANQWKAFRYAIARGRGRWTPYSWTFATTSGVSHLTLYVLTEVRVATSFSIDEIQFQSGRTAAALLRNEKPSPRVAQILPIYNTWLAVAIELGVVAAVFLAALAAGAPYYAYKLGDRAAAFAFVGLLVPSLTEDFVYGASLVTLTWLGALGLAVTAD